ncbi:hypothetical protein [Halobaculum litoreum]|uniref:Uncharacterized protein n=1 Tax=Halobaculum litoreum TaxID=3031998 RepID=A0ABD5XV95_9EURY|nr:hypothetical protein [Halobaculum sp. DT92]
MILTGLLTCLVLVAGGTALLSDDETQILIENERESSYQVTAYQIAQEDRRELRFEVTTGEGRQRLVGMEALRTEANYTDVTPADPVRSDRVPTVRNGNSTKFVGDWNRSQLTVYVVESHRNGWWASTSRGVRATWHSRSRPFKTGASQLRRAACRTCTGNPDARGVRG